MQGVYMRYGDLVTLTNQVFSGVLTTFGFLNTACYLQELPDNDLRQVLNSRSMIFQVVPKLNYENAGELHKAKKLTKQKTKQEGGTELLKIDLESIENLQHKAQSEQDLNDRTISQKSGEPVFYGQEIQLKHDASQMMLAGKHETAEGDRSCYRLTLDHGSSGTVLKVHPRYKFRQEGDPVMYADVVVLTCVKLGMYVHVSSEPITVEKLVTPTLVNTSVCKDVSSVESTVGVKYEVNVSSEKSTFQFMQFGTVTEDKNYLKGGSVVRLTHTELEGLLCCEGIDYTKDGLADVYIRKYRGEDLLERTSAHTLFILERNDRTHCGKTCTWLRDGQMTEYRLRHFTTRRIICVTADNKDTVLSLAPHPHERGPSVDESGTLFCLEPTAVETSEKIRDNAIGKIKAKTTEQYLSTTSEEWPQDTAREESPTLAFSDRSQSENDYFIPLEIEELSVIRKKIVLTSNSAIEDAYRITIVNPEETQEIEYIMSAISQLQSFGAAFEQNSEPSHTAYKGMEGILGKLILFCNESEDRDPYTCEGTPVPRRQKFMRELGVIDLVCNVLFQPFSSGKYALETLGKSEMMTKICTLGYRLVRLAAKDNRANELYSAQWMGLFFSHAERTTQNMFLHPEDTVTEILSDNRRLLERHLRPKMIERFVGLIRRYRDARYVKLVSTLCICDGQAISRNQNAICEIMKMDSGFMETLMMPIKISRSVIEVEVREYRMWVTLADLERMSIDRDHGNVYNYFLALLDLVSNLSYDRNHQSDTLRNYYTWETCFACASSPDLNDVLRSKFVRVMIYLHLDQGEIQSLQLPNLTRVWTEISFAGQIPCAKGMLPALITHTKVFVEEFLKEEDGIQRSADADRNVLMKEVLLLAKFLVTCGVYTSVQELQTLVQPLVHLLDGTSDLVTEIRTGSTLRALSAVSQRSKEGEDWKGRYRMVEDNAIIMECKQIICSILSFITVIRLDIQLSKLLTNLKSEDLLWSETVLGFPHKKHGDSDDDIFFGEYSKSSVQPSRQHSQLIWNDSVPEEDPFTLAINIVNKSLSDPLLDFSKSSGKNLFAILMDLMLYNNPGVVQQSFTLLLRHFTTRNVLVTSLQHVQMLENEEEVQTFTEAKEQISELKRAAESAEMWLGREFQSGKLISTSSDQEVSQTQARVTEILLHFIDLCSKQRRFMQTVSGQRTQESSFKMGLKPPEPIHLKCRASTTEANYLYTSPREFDSSIPINLAHDTEERLAGMLFSTSEVPNKEIQRLFRNMKVYLPVLEIAGHKGMMVGYSEEKHRIVLRHCYLFLAKFCHKNPVNQELLAGNLESCLEDLNKDVCAGVMLQEVFRNNEKLCGEVSEKLVRMIVRQINNTPMSMSKCSLFNVLSVLVKSNGTLFKSTQLEIVRQLSSAEMTNIFQVYSNSEELNNLERSIRECVRLYSGEPPNIQQKQINIPLPACYLIELIDLLSTCSEEWNAAAELMCQRMLTLPQIDRLLDISQFFWPLRNVLVLFFLNVYLDIEFSMTEHDKPLWDLLERVNADMSYIYQNYTRGGKSYHAEIELTYFLFGDRRANVWEFAMHYVYRALIPTLTEVFTKRGAGLNVDSKADLVKSLIHFVVLYHKITPSEIHLEATTQLLTVLQNLEKFRKYVTDADLSRRSLHKSVHDDPKPPLSFESGKAKQLSNIAQGIAKSKSFAAGEEQEFSQMVVFMRDVEKISTESFPSGHVITTKELLAAFVHFLQEETDANRFDIPVVGLKVLRKFIELANGEKPTPAAEWDTKDWIRNQASIAINQQLLTQLQAVHLVLSLFTKSPSKKVKAECLLFMIAMLLGGTKAVQDEFLRQFQVDENNDFLQMVRTTLVSAYDTTRTSSRNTILEREKRLRQKQTTDLEFQVTEGTEPEVKEESWISKDMDMLIEGVEEVHVLPVDMARNVLRFIQLLCEGHNLQTQDYLREQRTGGVLNSRSINFVSTIGDFLSLYTKVLHHNNVEVGFQLLDTLTEMVQGPCRGNQAELSQTQIIDSGRDLLTCLRYVQDRQVRGLDGDDGKEFISELKSKTANFLLSLLEGETDQAIIDRITGSLDFPRIRERMADVFTSFVEERLHLNSQTVKLSQVRDAIEKDSFDEHIAEGFNLYFLMNKLADNNTEAKKNLPSKSHKDKHELMAFTFFKANTGRIEILVGKTLQRIYFPILPVCRCISETSKRELLEQVDRSTPASKAIGLLSKSWKLIAEMEHLERISHMAIELNMEKYEFLRNLCFALSFFINLLILFFYQFTFLEDNYMSSGVQTIIRICGIVLVVIAAVTFTLWLLVQGSIQVKTKWRERVLRTGKSRPAPDVLTPDYLQSLTFKDTYQILLARGPDAIEFHQSDHRDFRHVATAVLYHLMSIKMVYESPTFKLLAGYTLFAGLGQIDYTFYALLLLDVMFRSQTLKGIVMAFKENRRQLLMTIMLLVVILFIYALWGFYIDPVQYYEAEIGDWGETLCQNLFECFLTTLNEGPRLPGGLGDILELFPFDEKEKWYSRFFLDSSYFIIVRNIFLMIIVGIIIDSFVQMREKKEFMEEDMKNKCFICSIERSELDREGDGYEKHCAEDHNVWNYIYFLVHLKNKDTTEYTGGESYCASLHQKMDVRWMPLHRAICMKDDTKEKQQEENMIEDATKRMDAMIEQVKEIKKALQESAQDTF